MLVRVDMAMGVNYSGHILQVLRTAEFDKWLAGLRDRMGLEQITARLDRLALGHCGDCRPVGGEVMELRIHAGPGYRVYY
jgi:putative addiction module killer protein